MKQKDFLILLALFLPLAGLVFSVCSDSYISRKHKRILLVIAAVAACLIGQNYAEYLLVVGEPNVRLRTVVAIIGYSIRPVILVLFLHIVSPKPEYRIAWILAVINAAVHLTALFSSVCFAIAENNHFVRGPLGRSCLFFSMILLVYLLYLTIRNYSGRRKTELILPILIVALIGLCTSLDGIADRAEQPVEFLTVAIVFSCIFYYIWLHLQFVREHEEDLKAQQRIRIMMSQIQPHFLYNTLSTIQVLCHLDPDRAAEITGEFGVYLRRNLTSLGEPGLIPFRKELEHTKTYVKIEETRFPNISVEYDIRDDAFSLPPLTIQPLVENAIRHGVRIREEGIVEIISRLSEGFHEILICDNGTGFDPKVLEDKSRQHIGIRNVRERVESMCGGTLEIDSRIGEGTTVIIRIPASGDEEGVL